MKKSALLTILGILILQITTAQKIISRQGQVSFFSYTSVENIKARNNQVSSIIDLESSEIAVSMLMNAFVFEKALMREHFNESYIETDLYPKATFQGKIIDFNKDSNDAQIKIIKGVFTMRGMSEELEIKTKIEPQGDHLLVSGSFETRVAAYDINIPPLLAGNIAKTITVDFLIEHEPYVEN